MVTEEQVREALGDVLVPQMHVSLADLNLVRRVEIDDGSIKVSLASTALNPDAQEWVEATARSALERIAQEEEVNLGFVEATPQELNEIGGTVAIMSGKGGVGKSLITSLLAISLNRQGSRVGILDADITGPSIPRMFGLDAHPAGSNTGILPVLSRSGIEIMSINLLLPKEDDAVIWRGPLIARAIQQFWEEVLWGSLDFLLVDLPPGTADAPLTVMQSIPLSGVVVALTPQDLTAMVVRKAVHMAQRMEVPVLGVVENMSYFVVPDTGKRIDIFGRSKGQDMAQAAGAPLLAQIPIDPNLASLCDQGRIEGYDSGLVKTFGEAFVRAVSARVPARSAQESQK